MSHGRRVPLISGSWAGHQSAANSNVSITAPNLNQPNSFKNSKNLWKWIKIKRKKIRATLNSITFEKKIVKKKCFFPSEKPGTELQAKRREGKKRNAWHIIYLSVEPGEEERKRLPCLPCCSSRTHKTRPRRAATVCYRSGRSAAAAAVVMCLRLRCWRLWTFLLFEHNKLLIRLQEKWRNYSLKVAFDGHVPCRLLHLLQLALKTQGCSQVFLTFY